MVETLTKSGLRCTSQRLGVFDVVLSSHDHPTAEEIFARARRSMPELSFATVYNCLSALVEHHLVRQVTLDRTPTRFCANLREHGHFYCDGCGAVLDIDLECGAALSGVNLPPGYKVASADLSIRGLCPACSPAA